MRTELLKIVVILLLTGSGDSRPQNRGDQVSVEEWKPIASPTVSAQLLQGDSRPESSNGQKTQVRDFKDLQHMNQSLRTVATQLLNVSESKHVVVKIDDGNVTKDHALPTKESHSGTNNSSHIGRPMNSKFGTYFESSHPGEAMALTEEELEREMSSTRLMTAYKNRPTTTGGISTWILLNPPSTTIKPVENEGDVNNRTIIPSAVAVTTLNPLSTAGMASTTTKTATTATTTTTTIKPTTKTISSTANSKVKQQKVTVLSPLITTSKPEKSTSSTKPSAANTTKNADKKGEVPPPTTVTKKIQTIRTTSNKPKVSTPKTSTTTTITPPPLSTTVQFVTKQKLPTTSPTSNRKVTPAYILKRNTTSSSKIEKVTFRPVQVISITKNQYNSTERPMFITKIKASVLTESQKTTTSTAAPPSTLSSPASSLSSMKPNITRTDLVERVPQNKIKSTGNKILKVQHKQPIDRTKTKIEIEPIRVNAPVLTIEKLEKKPTGIEDVEGPIIDLKFDFNPELTKINQVEQSGTTIKSTSESSTTNSSTPVKRRRKNSKRKKNKGRRRKPSTTSTTVPVSSTTETAMIEIITSSMKPFDDDVQESKIDPIESKIASTNSTKTKKKPTQVKPISTQIYNFLSREVMPSVGMMSLVGLGLGLASYFLYPFGGGINRRNYEVEPNYKYNMDEYGGNYGQTEEEVLSKILQGAASDDKQKEIPDHNYYRYQHYEGIYDSTAQTTRRYTGNPVYKPVESTASPLKHRNADFRYDTISATTVGDYHTIDEKQLGPEYVVGTDVGVANRQFVVGNVPKDLSLNSASNVDKQRTEHRTQNLDYLTPNGVYANTQTSKNADEGYEEIEITPTAVAVEHGPRALRMKRDSVIQVIPSRKEIEEEEKEEDLSNEIFDIIDSAIPHTEDKSETNKKDVGNLDAQEKKDQKPQETQDKVPATQEPSTATITTTTNNETINDYTIEALQVTSVKSDESTSPSVTTTAESLSSLATKDESSSSTVKNDVKNPGTTTIDWLHEFNFTTKNPTTTEGFNIFNFVRKVAEIKFRLGLTILKHASEGFARYLGHVQKRINGEE